MTSEAASPANKHLVTLILLLLCSYPLKRMQRAVTKVSQLPSQSAARIATHHTTKDQGGRLHNHRFGSPADIATCPRNVRFAPENGRPRNAVWPTSTPSYRLFAPE